VLELRTSGEIDAMRAAGEVVARMLAATRAAVAPGVRLRELDEIARTVLDEAGAGAPFLDYQPHPGMPPYPGVICTSVNDVALHGIPTGRRLAEGDLLSIDAGASLDGWVGDSAISLTVGAGRDEDHALIAAAEERFRVFGGTRADAMVLDDNTEAHAAWSAGGYRRQADWSRWVKPLPN